MPMQRHKYPKEWKQIAEEFKDAAGWKCQECEIGHMEDGSMGSCLTVHHPNRDPENRDAVKKALCARCHLAAERELRRKEKGNE